MRTDGQTDTRIDMTKLTVAFRNFANAPKNAYIYIYIYMHIFHTRGIFFLAGLKARSDEVLKEYCWAITWKRKSHVAASRVPLLLTLLPMYILIHKYHTPRLIRRIFFSRNPQNSPCVLTPDGVGY